MAVVKRVLCPQRLRRVPSQFSWIDHRLIRHKHICRCSHPALALYLFLVTVCDGQGLSYWSDASLGRMLRLDPVALARAREELINATLIAYQPPLYQVLALEDADRASTRTPSPSQMPRPARLSAAAQPPPPQAPRPAGPPLSFGQILQQILEHAP
jgi:hypothetical protein